MAIFTIDGGIILIVSVSRLNEKLGAAYHIISVGSFEIWRFSDVADRRHYVANTFANGMDGILMGDRRGWVGNLEEIIGLKIYLIWAIFKKLIHGVFGCPKSQVSAQL